MSAFVNITVGKEYMLDVGRMSPMLVKVEKICESSVIVVQKFVNVKREFGINFFQKNVLQ